MSSAVTAEVEAEKTGEAAVKVAAEAGDKDKSLLRCKQCKPFKNY
jgi:hypothetical protein